MLKKARIEKENREIDRELRRKVNEIERSRGKGLLEKLNRMFPVVLLLLVLSCASREYVYVEPVMPSVHPEPIYLPVEWQEREGLYCLDERNAKNLLRNIELMKAYKRKLLNILEEYSEKSQR